MVDEHTQVYWILDVKKDVNQAIETSEYWPLPANQGNVVAVDADSIQLENVPPDARGGVTDEEAPIQNGPSIQNGAPISPGPQHLAMTHPQSQNQSLKDFHEYLFGTEGLRMKGNWTDLAGTSLAWLLLDFSFYLLGVNSARLVPHMFEMPDVPKAKTQYDVIHRSSWHSLVATSIGAVLGGAIAIKIMNNFSRKKIQMWSFLVLGILFMIMGILYIKMLGTGGAVIIVAVYVLCQLTFNIGMHPRRRESTFADSFPSFRCKHDNVHRKLSP